MGREAHFGENPETNAGRIKAPEWLTAIYIRLGHEDGNNESESVANQRKIICEAMDELFRGDSYAVAYEQIDNGTSGTTDLE